MPNIVDRGAGRKTKASKNSNGHDAVEHRDSNSTISPLTKLRFLKAALADLGHSLAFTVLSALVSHHNSQTGRCFPKHSSIAKIARRTRRSVIRAVDSLEQRGWVKSAVVGDGKTPNSYSFPWERGNQGGDTSVTSDTNVTPQVTLLARTGDTNVTPQVTPVSHKKELPHLKDSGRSILGR
jgi:hypothetical protein